MPAEALARRGDPAEVPPDLLGLFVGPTLAELDDDRLRDIGRTRAEAQAEAAKPFWRR
jgi:hypothetical protein